MSFKIIQTDYIYNGDNLYSFSINGKEDNLRQYTIFRIMYPQLTDSYLTFSINNIPIMDNKGIYHIDFPSICKLDLCIFDFINGVNIQICNKLKSSDSQLIFNNKEYNDIKRLGDNIIDYNYILNNLENY